MCFCIYVDFDMFISLSRKTGGNLTKLSLLNVVSLF